jgi:septum formation protein
MTPVVLASQSPARAALLRGAGVSFTARSPGVDEAAMKAALLADGAKARDIADALAELKAVRVSKRVDGLVIGADQTLEFDGALVDKAESLDEARTRLLSYRGRNHTLHSAVVVAQNGQPIWREVKSARMGVRDFSEAWLDGYLAREGEHLLGSLGCYRLEGEGLQLFDRVDGDYFTILGLPMIGLLDLLRRYGALPA